MVSGDCTIAYTWEEIVARLLNTIPDNIKITYLSYQINRLGNGENHNLPKHNKHFLTGKCFFNTIVSERSMKQTNIKNIQ